MAGLNVSALSPADQQAFQAWQQQVQALIQASGGGIPAPVSYAMQHPEYLQTHPEIQAQTDLLTGKTLPPSVQQQITGSHLDTSGAAPTFSENKGFWSHPESWLQLAFGAGLGGAAALGGLGGAAGAASSGAGAGSAGAGAGTAAAAGGGGAGILGTASKIAGLVGQGATALAAGNAQGKIDQNTINNRADLLALQRYQEQLSAAGLNLAAPQTRLRTSVAGDVAANAQPFHYTGSTHMVGNIPVPEHTGGLSPALFSPNTRALGGQMSTQALADNTAMGGKAIGEPPALSTPPNIGTGGNLLNTAGIIGGLVPLFGDVLGKYQTQPVKKTLDPNDWSNP